VKEIETEKNQADQQAISIQFYKRFKRADDLYREKMGRELGAAAGLMERRRAYHEWFMGLDPEQELSLKKDILPQVTFTNYNRLKGYFERMKIKIPHNRGELYEIQDSFLPFVLAAMAVDLNEETRKAIVENMGSTSKFIGRQLSESGLFPGIRIPNSWPLFPPEIETAISEFKSERASAAGEMVTKEYLAHKSGRSFWLVSLRLATAKVPSEELLSDNGVLRDHYDIELAMRAILRPNPNGRDRGRHSLSSIAREFMVDVSTVIYRARKLKIKPVGRGYGYLSEDIARIRQDFINNPVNRDLQKLKIGQWQRKNNDEKNDII
jgi:hypothetical protein